MPIQTRLLWLWPMAMAAFAWHLPLTAGSAVWWEGESAVKHDFVEAPWLKTEIRKTRLSKMDWLCNFVARDSADLKPAYTAEYRIEVATAGKYTLWVREFYRRGATPWRFRFNDGEWVAVANDHPHVDITDLGQDRSAVWCQYGPFQLVPGPLRFTLEVLPQAGRDVISGFDAFLLIDENFVPNGAKKPLVLSKHEYIGTFIWLEGEEAASNFVNQERRLPAENPKLSGGKQLVLSRPGAAGPFAAKWPLISTTADNYHLWLRQTDHDQSSPYRYRLNNGEWQEMPGRETAVDRVSFGNQHGASWLYHGRHPLLEGDNSLEVEVTDPAGDGHHHLGIDAICLSLEPFQPNGRHRPDAVIAAVQKGWFPFRALGGASPDEPVVLDLSHLNEKQAGAQGHCRLDANAGLVFGDGRPARFWGVNAGFLMHTGRGEAEEFMERMARFGVNLIRFDGPLQATGSKAFGACDRAALDQLHYLVAACRRHGLYAALANYAATDYEAGGQQKLAGYDAIPDKAPRHLLLVNPEFRARYLEWTSFLAAVNPYAKVSLAQDPAVAWLELQQEDSLFSPTMASLPREQLQLIEDEYNRWLKTRYGSEMHIIRSWSVPGLYHPVVPEDGRQGARCFRLLPPDAFQPAAIDGKEQLHLRRRKTDQLHFLADLQRRIYAELTGFLRERRGVRCLVATGTAAVASPRLQGALEDWTRTSGHLIVNRRLTTPLTETPTGTLVAGMRYQSRSALLNPFASPALNPVYAGHGNILAAVAWPMPNDYRAEATAVVAAYTSLQGGNGCVWYRAEAPGWAGHLQAFTIQSPCLLGAFPGYALLFRRGDLQAGRPVVDQAINLVEQYEFRGTGVDTAEEQAQAKLAEMLGFQRKTYGDNLFDPALFLVGPVARSFADKAGRLTVAADAAPLHDRRKGIIRSATGEIMLDYQNGLLTIDTPRAQAAVGFLKKAGARKLGDITVAGENEYANILAISLDGQPLAKSAQILVEVTTRERNFGWKEESLPRSAAVDLKEAGEPPILLEAPRGTVTFHGQRAAQWQARTLNYQGHQVADAALADGPDGMVLALPDDAIHVKLTRP